MNRARRAFDRRSGSKLDRAPRLKREIVKTRLRVLTRFPKAREQRMACKTPSPARLKGHILPVGTRPIRQDMPRATASVAERKRSRSGVDTGQRTGSCFGLCCSSGGKTGYGFPAVLGQALGWNLGRERVARFFEPPASSPSGFAAWGDGRQAEHDSFGR